MERHLAILVGGGPAPGINSVISAAAIEAANSGMRVTGLYDGLKRLVADRFDAARHTVDLLEQDLDAVHSAGGSVIRTSRANLLDEDMARSGRAVPDRGKVQRVLRRLRRLGITHLLSIGGDDTALSARLVADWSKGRVRVAHCPKTIDNDLPLPDDMVTFGFSTAKHNGAKIAQSLMEDAKTTRRWYIIVAMGRNAGFLALGIGKAAGATLTLIPEEFREGVTFPQIADVIEGAMLKREALTGRRDGVVVVAEGLVYRMGGLEAVRRSLGRDVPLDAAGHLRLSEVPLARLLRGELARRFEERGDPITMVGETLGYELRSAAPTPYDMSYCRDLGHGAVRMLLDPDCPNAMATMRAGRIRPMPFDDMIDPSTGRTRVRLVSLGSDEYRVARAYMTRLEPPDLASKAKVSRMAKIARMGRDEFLERFRPVVGTICEAPPEDGGIW